MSEEIQLQKPNSNIYCYVNFVATGGRITVNCDFMEYNPATEDNYPIRIQILTLKEFNNMLEKEKWIVW